MSSDAPVPDAVVPQSIANPLYTLEHSLYVGNYISGMLYACSLILYVATMRGLIWRKGLKPMTLKTRRFYGIYTTIMFIMLTMDIVVNALWCELAWIDGRGHPGGITGYIVENLAVWYQTMGSVTVVVIIFMGDALLLHRLYIFWGQNKYVLIVPTLAYLAGFSLAIVQVISAAVPGSQSLFGGKAINFGIPYYAITIALNVVLTSAIFFRLRRLSGRAIAALGHEDTRTFTGFIALLIESAAIYSIFGIMFLVPYATGSQTALAFGQVWAKLTCVCPQLIIFRIISGKAWDRETIQQVELTATSGANIGIASGVQILRSHAGESQFDEDKRSVQSSQRKS